MLRDKLTGATVPSSLAVYQLQVKSDERKARNVSLLKNIKIPMMSAINKMELALSVLRDY